MPDPQITVLTDIEPERVDLVKNPANGFPILMLKSVDKAVSASGAVNEKPDIAAAQKILTQLACLIQSEASEMAAGELDETCDIGLLLEAANLMKWFLAGEQAADGMEKQLAEAEALIARKEQSVTESKTDAAPEGDGVTKTEDKTSEAPESQAETQPDTAALVKEAVAEASKAHEEAIKELRAELAKVKATPLPGGPAITAPPHMRAEATQVDQLAKAARFERMAESVTEPDLKREYLARAAAAKAAAGMPTA